MLKKFYLSQLLYQKASYPDFFCSRTDLYRIDEFRGRDDIIRTLQTIQLNQLAKTA